MTYYQCPHCGKTIRIELPQPPESKIVGKMGGLAVNDVTSNHNLVAEQQKRQQIREWLSRPRHYERGDLGYDNLTAHEHSELLDRRRARIGEQQRKQGFV